MNKFEPRFDAAFRLDLEQQRKRAKDLLRAARNDELEAIARLDSAQARLDGTAPRLADAQRTIAHELGLENWAALRQHIAALDSHRAAFAGPPPDSDRRTLHLRCGSDIHDGLRAAGFRGDFLELAYPYATGPVSADPQSFDEQVNYILESGGASLGLTRDALHQRFSEENARLQQSSQYERVVIWSEHDVHDQLALLRYLAHYATQGAPHQLELIEIAHFPGGRRFVGLGQLPPEAFRLLWKSRRPVTSAQLGIGREGWQALCAGDPRKLVELEARRQRDLPLLSSALHRLLQELPSAQHGLSSTQLRLLAMLSLLPPERRQMQARLVGAVMMSDPLPGQPDLHIGDLLQALVGVGLIERLPGPPDSGRSPPWSDLLRLTPLGRQVFDGQVDAMTLDLPPRWVGGVRIAAGEPDWRWDEQTARVLRR
ncbi:MAG: DUF1835 domain-containing protein [Gammaproteobacteria bacterium]|nr:DUF1835 domain-containing protein [Gammaproteobacteria bacterium]